MKRKAARAENQKHWVRPFRDPLGPIIKGAIFRTVSDRSMAAVLMPALTSDSHHAAASS